MYRITSPRIENHVYSSLYTCSSNTSGLQHLQMDHASIRPRERVLDRPESIWSSRFAQTLRADESCSVPDRHRRSHADSGFAGVWSSSDLAGFFQQKISPGCMRCRLFHHCAVRAFRTDLADQACRKVQHRKSNPVLSADRDHHRHTARGDLYHGILNYLPSTGASGRNICRSVTSARTLI